jgi:hypothetical protein
LFGKGLETNVSAPASGFRHGASLARLDRQVCPAACHLRRITFGVSKFWIPHVALVHFIYYILFSPQKRAGQNPFWTLGTLIRVLVGGKAVEVAVAFMWTVHAFEAAYTIILARRYETTFVVGVRRPTDWAKKMKVNCAPKLLAIVCARCAPIWETWVGRAFQ